MPITILQLRAGSRSGTADAGADRRPARRFHGLDAIRGVAALFVAMFHIPFVAPCLRSPEAILAVDLFFCLSGVVLAEAYGRRLAQGLGWRAFMGLRLLRLYPLYLVSTLVGLAIIAARPHDPGTAVMLVVMAVFLLPLGGAVAFPLNGPAWSLCDEFIASAAFGVLSSRMPRSCCVTLWIVSASMLAGFCLVTGRTSVDVGTTTANFPAGVLRMAVSFFAGLSLHASYAAARRPPARSIEGNLGICAILMIVAAVLMVRPHGTWRLAYELAVVTMIFPLLVYAALWCRPTGLVSKLAVWAGAVSYPLYILHQPVQMLAKIVVTGNPIEMPAALPALPVWSAWALIGGLLAVSWLCSVAIDRPLHRFASAKWARRPPATAGRLSTAAPCP